VAHLECTLSRSYNIALTPSSSSQSGLPHTMGAANELSFLCSEPCVPNYTSPEIVILQIDCMPAYVLQSFRGPQHIVTSTDIAIVSGCLSPKYQLPSLWRRCCPTALPRLPPENVWFLLTWQASDGHIFCNFQIHILPWFPCTLLYDMGDPNSKRKAASLNV
jgi:hypothetical protein